LGSSISSKPLIAVDVRYARYLQCIIFATR